jgi:hypothetical protein
MTLIERVLGLGYGVCWGSRQVAIPACASAAFVEIGPLINTACSELEETNNLRLASGRIDKLPTVNLVSTKAIRCNEMLLVDYGRSEVLRQGDCGRQEDCPSQARQAACLPSCLQKSVFAPMSIADKLHISPGV